MTNTFNFFNALLHTNYGSPVAPSVYEALTLVSERLLYYIVFDGFICSKIA